MRELISSIRDIVTIIAPLVMEFKRALKDKEIRDLTKDLKDALTAEEKREAARKICDILYRDS